MKLTVISAAYNVISSVGLDRMIASIRSVASLPIEHEHLIFDGASTDGTVEELRRLEEEIPSLKVVSEKDSGIYEALNKGLRAATGEYLYVIGLDDLIIDPAAFASCVDDAERESADILIAKVKWGERAGTFPTLRRDIYKFFSHHSYSHQGCLVRTAKAKALGFDEKYRIAADYKQLLTLHWSGAKAMYRERVIAEFAESGLSAVQSAKALAETAAVQKDVFGDKKLFAVMLHFLFSRSGFSRRIALAVFKDWLWRKVKANGVSTYYLFDLAIYKHQHK